MPRSLWMLALFLMAVLIGELPSQATSAQGPTRAQSGIVGSWEGEADTGKWPLYLNVELARNEEGLAGKLFVLGQALDFSQVQQSGDRLTAILGEAPGGLVITGRVSGSDWVGELRQGDVGYPFTLSRVAENPKPADRIGAWKQDLDALDQRFLHYDRSFTPAEKALFLEATASLRSELPTLGDSEILARMASAVALGDNAHSRLYLLRNRTELRRIPVRLWWFTDGLFVVSATEAHRALLGCRVTAVAGTDVRHARGIVSRLYAGNESWDDYMSVYSLTSPEMLHGVGITNTPDSAEYELADCGSAGKVTLPALPLARSTSAVEAWWDLASSHPKRDTEWVQVLEGSNGNVPLYLRNPDRNYWYEYLPETGLLYFQYNRASNMEDESIAQFSERLLKAFEQHPVKAIALDLRFNTGGNSNLFKDLTEKLLERTRDMPRFLITGRATFSAGIVPAAAWREAGNVTIVGEPVGDVLDFWAEGGNIILPNSGIAAHFANGAHSYSPAPCPAGIYCVDTSSPSLAPDIPASPSFNEYRSGEDPALQAILARLR